MNDALERKVEILENEVDELRIFRARVEEKHKMLTLVLRFFGVFMAVLAIGEAILQRGLFK